MKKEAWLDMGLTEEQAAQAAAAVAEELRGFIPKSRFDEVLEERNALRAACEQERARLAAVEDAAAEREDLARQVAELQAEAVRQRDAHAAQLQTMAVDNALRLALADAHDPALAAGLIDRTALLPADDGSIDGLEEQVRALREAKPFLFRETGAGIAVGAAPAAESLPSGAALSLRDAIAGHFQAKRG